MRRYTVLLKRLAASSKNQKSWLQSSQDLTQIEQKGFKTAEVARGFSNKAALSTAAAEAKSNPAIAYGAVGLFGLGGLAYYFSGSSNEKVGLTGVTNQVAATPPADKDEYGSFKVQDHLGMWFTQEELLGDFAVLFFGSIDHPGRKERLLQMAEAVMESDRQSNMHYLTPVFATLKPETDDVVKMNAMVEDYASALNRKSILNVRLKGITGKDNLKVHELAQAYTSKVKGRQGAKNDVKVTANDQSDLYLVNPEGEFIASYGPELSSKDIGRDWAEIIKAYKLSHPSWHGPKAVKTRAA